MITALISFQVVKFIIGGLILILLTFLIFAGLLMFNAICDVSCTNKTRAKAMLFSEKILPALQEVLKKEIESEKK